MIDISSWSITETGSGKWVIKIIEGTSDIPIKSVDVYKDIDICLAELYLANGNVFGYSLEVIDKIKFGYLNRSWYLQIINKNVKEHSKPKIVFSNKLLYLYRFNGKKDCDYWIALRKKEGEVEESIIILH